MIDKVIDIAKGAGRIIMKYYKGQYNVKTKTDKNDFVTTADLESQKYIIKRLKQEFPDDFIMSEESDNKGLDFSKRLWIVDPLDGTKRFIDEETGFCVSIGLCIKGIPFLGVVYAPARDVLFFAEKGKGAFMRKSGKQERIHVTDVKFISDAFLVKSHPFREVPPLGKIVDSLKVKESGFEGSCTLKICKVACGQADLFITPFANRCKWDTCAGQVILEEAGGMITNPFGNPLNYMQESNIWKIPFVASNSVLHEAVINEIKKIKEIKK